MTTDLMQDATPPPLQTKAPAEEGTDVGSGASMESSVKKPQKEPSRMRSKPATSAAVALHQSIRE